MATVSRSNRLQASYQVAAACLALVLVVLTSLQPWTTLASRSKPHYGRLPQSLMQGLESKGLPLQESDYETYVHWAKSLNLPVVPPMDGTAMRAGSETDEQGGGMQRSREPMVVLDEPRERAQFLAEALEEEPNPSLPADDAAGSLKLFEKFMNHRFDLRRRNEPGQEATLKAVRMQSLTKAGPEDGAGQGELRGKTARKLGEVAGCGAAATTEIEKVRKEVEKKAAKVNKRQAKLRARAERLQVKEASVDALVEERSEQRARAMDQGKEAYIRRMEVELRLVKGEMGKAMTGADMASCSPREEQAQKKEKPRVLVATKVPQAHCGSGARGEKAVLKSVKNKVDYAQRHGFGILVATKDQSSPHLGARWSKVALLQSLLDGPASEGYDWLLLVDPDVLITDMDFQPPVARYPDADFIAAGNMTTAFSPRPNFKTSLSTGILLVRICDWSRELVAAWAAVGAGPVLRTNSEKANAVLEENVPSEEMWPKAGLLYLLAINATWHDRIKLVSYDDDWLLEGWHRYEVAKVRLWSEAGTRSSEPEHLPFPFSIHWAGCQICTGGDVNTVDECLGSLEMVFDVVDKEIWKGLGLQHQPGMSRLSEAAGTIESKESMAGKATA